MATRPSTDERAKPAPSGKARTQRVCALRLLSRFCSLRPCSRLHQLSHSVAQHSRSALSQPVSLADPCDQSLYHKLGLRPLVRWHGCISLSSCLARPLWCIGLPVQTCTWCLLSLGKLG